MAVEIKSGSSTDLQTVDPISKAARVTLYNSDGVEGTKEIPVAIISAPVTAVDNDIISSIDVTEYKTISLQLTGVWEGTVTFQGSNDNGTFYDIVAQDVTSLTSPYSIDTTTNGLFNVPVVYKHFRARLTTFISGTVDCKAYGHKEDKNLNSVGQVGTVTLASETTKVIGTVNVSTGDSYVAGSITASDTSLAAPTHDGSLLTGTPSVSSFFASQGNSAYSTWIVEVAGDLGGATFYFEGSTGSTDGTDGSWVSLTSLQRGLLDSPLSYFTTTEGEFSGNATGLSYFRVRAVGGVGVNATVGLNFSRGAIAVNFNSPMPAGTNVIGSIDNVAKLGGVAVSMGGGVSDSGTQRVTLASDEPLAEVTNLAQLGGVAVTMGGGATDAGTQRVSIASDGALAEVTNLAQIGGAAVSMGGGVSDAGTQRVSIASDETVTLAAGTAYVGNVVVIADPNAPAYQTDFYVTGVGGVDVNSRMIRTGACSLISVVMTSYAATPRHIKLYDTGTTPVAGTGTPVLVLTRSSSGNNSYPLPAGGFPFANGIGMTFVQGAADNNAVGTATVDASMTAIFT